MIKAIQSGSVSMKIDRYLESVKLYGKASDPSREARSALYNGLCDYLGAIGETVTPQMGLWFENAGDGEKLFFGHGKNNIELKGGI